jgi:hypothetical protein
MDIPSETPSVPIADGATDAVPSHVEQSQPTDQREQILSMVIEQTEVVWPPPNWERFGTIPRHRKLAEPRDFLLDRLLRRFPEADLLAAGVVNQSPGGIFSLAPVFGHEATSFRVHELNEGMISALSVRGIFPTAPSHRCPSVADLTNSEKPQPLTLVATTDAEAWILDRLNLNWAAGQELFRLTGKRVQQIFSPAAAEQNLPRSKFTIVGWQLEKLVNELSPTTVGLIRQIADIQSVYGFDPATKFDVWVPSPSEFEAIIKAHSFADPTAIAKAFKKSITASTRTPSEVLSALIKPPPPSLEVAEAELRKQVERAKKAAVRAAMVEALEKYQEAYEYHILAPLQNVDQRYRLTPIDGRQALAGLAAVRLARSYFEDDPLVRAARRAIALDVPTFTEAMDNEGINRQLKFVDAMLKIDRLHR